MRGRTALVTGASSGLGLASARALAGRGARVLLSARDQAKGDAAVAAVRDAVPEADVELVMLDLASLQSVEHAASDVSDRTDRLDVLMNNAGVMMPPSRRVTADGFELQMGTNHLGHFALTGRLLPLLTATPGSRVVTVSSLAARGGRIDLDDLQAERSYQPQPTYGASKLANLLFTFELQRRLHTAGAAPIALAAHPGVSSTNLMSSMEQPRWVNRFAGLLMQSPDQGARPQLHAATSPDVAGGDYLGPRGLAEVRGRRVGPATVPPAAEDEDWAAALWAMSEELTGVPIDPVATG